MSGTEGTELNRIREEYGDLMNEEDKEHFPTAQEQAKKKYEERREREKQEMQRNAFRSDLLYQQSNQCFFTCIVYMYLHMFYNGTTVFYEHWFFVAAFFLLGVFSVLCYIRLNFFDVKKSEASYG